MAVESPETMEIKSYPLGKYSALEVHERKDGPDFIVRNTKTGVLFDLKTILAKGDRFIRGKDWGREIDAVQGLGARIHIPPLPEEKSRENGRNIFMTVLHEISHADTGPVRGSLLNSSRMYYFYRTAQDEKRSPREESSAIFFELVVKMQNERRTWAKALTHARHIAKAVRDEVLEVPEGSKLYDVVHTPLGTYEQIFERITRDMLPPGYSSERLRRDLVGHSDVMERIEILRQLFETNLHVQAPSRVFRFEEFVFKLFDWDKDALRSRLAQFNSRMSGQETLDLAARIGDLVARP